MDWDLNAIVRSCSSSATNSAPKSTTVAGQNTQPPAAVEAEDNPFIDFSDPTNPENNHLQELQSSFMPFLANSTSKSNFLDSPVSDIRAVCGPFPPPETAVTLHHNQRPQLHHEIQASNVVLPMRTTQSSASRPRKKKNSQKKLVMQVSAENLSKDVWAWRKYGQKPIKGSPYPRNYYRCSSSKGCTARKQVERSNTDPNLFTVSYTGDHCHPRPAHRNSLAGSVRTKIPASQNRENTELEAAPASGGKEIDGLSPTTPLSTAAENETRNSLDVNGEFFAGEETEVEDDDVLIPNMNALDEDLIKSLNLQQLSGGGDGSRRNLDFGNHFAA